MKQNKDPHFDHLPTRQTNPKGEEEKKSSLIFNETILLKLSAIEELLKRKEDKPLNFKEACTYLGYAPSYLYKLTYKNVIPHYKPTGKIIFFSKNELDEWIFTNGESARNSTDKLRVQNAESKNEDVSFSLGIADPNQVEMFGTSASLSDQTEKKAEVEKEIIIEFPLKSRRRKEL